MSNKRKLDIDKEVKIIEAAKKDHRNFAPLYNQYFDQIFRFVYKRVGDEALCGDLTSQVFFKALSNLKKYKHAGYPFSSWLYRIAINEVNMHFRKAKRHQVVEVKETDVRVMMKEMDQGPDLDEQIAKMLDCLGQLSEDQQRLIELRFFDKCSFKEIGAIFGITEGNAKIKTYRALDKLKKLVGFEKV